MKKVKYVGADDLQVNWGNNDDPRKYLTEGSIYEVLKEEVHSWHTKIVLRGFDEFKFNSSSFENIH